MVIVTKISYDNDVLTQSLFSLYLSFRQPVNCFLNLYQQIITSHGYFDRQTKIGTYLVGNLLPFCLTQGRRVGGTS